MTKPFVNVFSCFSPKRIWNRYSKEWITVGCGVCKACLLKQSRQKSLLCQIQEQDYKYCMFVTTTYKNEFVPLMRAEKDVDANCYRFYDVTDRFSKENNIFGSYLFSDSIDDFKLTQIIGKTRNKTLSGVDIPYLCKKDAQKFLKRLRKELTRYTDEKVRYYLVGEYGPIHFRPHFHFLFYFNSEDTFKNFRKCVLLGWSTRTRYYNKKQKVWKSKSCSFGRVDFSLSRGKCSSYLAGYVNSRVSMPRLFTHNACCPFSSHSKRFAQSFYQNAKEEIYENEPSYFVQTLQLCYVRITELHPWRSLVSLYFPKVVGYRRMSDNELSYAYRLYAKARHIYKTDSVTEIVDNIINDILTLSLSSDDYGVIVNPSVKEELLTFCCYYGSVIYSELVEYISKNMSEDYSKLRARLCHLFYVSKHFHVFCCDSKTNLFSRRISQIKRYYAYIDYERLRDQYSTYNDKLDYNGNGIIPYLYDNFNSALPYLDVSMPYMRDFLETYLKNADDESYKKLNSYVDLRYNTDVSFSQSIKHKALNDANYIFMY